MKNKILTVLLCVLGASLLSGCQLALEKGNLMTNNDELIGVLITDDYIDTFDFEAYASDHIDELMNGETVSLAEQSKYQGRVYSYVHEPIDGSNHTVMHQFGDIKGEYVIFPQWKDKSGNSYQAFRQTDGICDADIKTNIVDGEEITTVSASLYHTAKNEGTFFAYVNPIYETDDGSVYVVPGHGYNVDSLPTEGEYYATTVKSAVTETNNGVTKSTQSEFTIHFCLAYAPKEITIHEMNAQNEEVTSRVFEPGTLPEYFFPERNAAYLIVETKKTDSDGNPVTTRILYEPAKDQQIGTVYVTDNDKLITQYTNVLWR